ncbi:MAG: phosphate ABC transporter permease subunit PstC [Pseudomonadota bacterium]|nr:phosphate ABC transporter permease subunit PstC [Pseudomonadota bacterium]
MNGLINCHAKCQVVGSRSLFLAATVVGVLLTLSIFAFMVMLGLPLFSVHSLTLLLTQAWAPDQGLYGVFPFICGTCAIVSLSLLIAFPLSLGNAILIHLLAPRRLARFLHQVVKMMTGVPTVIYGFVGIFFLVPLVREWFSRGSGMCILSAALLLALLISPTMILVFLESFAAIPATHLRALEALGGTRRQKLLHVILPGARTGIITGLLLALGRALGDTMIALMVAGNATAQPESLLDSVRTLTAHIALVMAADFDSIEFKTIFACGIILYLWTAVLTLSLRYLHFNSAKLKS